MFACVKLGNGRGATRSIGDGGLIVLGLCGDAPSALKVSVELNDSLVFWLLREKVEDIELVRVLELLPGSRVMGDRIGVEGLEGRGNKLGRRGKMTLGLPISTRKAVAWASLL